MYNLKFNKKQLAVMENALHYYTRLLVGQFKIATEPVSELWGNIYEKLDKNQKALIDLIQASFTYDTMHGQTKESEIAWDIMQVLRHQIWEENNGEEWNVASSVTRMGSEKLPKITKIQK